MNHPKRRLLLTWTAFILMAVLGLSCKSHKKAMEATNKPSTENADSVRRAQEEARRKAEEEAAAKREAEAKANQQAAYSKLEQYFGSISRAGNTASANQSIQEALSLFATDDTPVLIVIHQSGSQKDYDKPTTIKQYLNYVKDTGNNQNKVQNLVFNDSGKITEVELVRK